jgi:hypothetical protein
MTDKKYATFADAPRGTMKGLRAVKPPGDSPTPVPEYRTTELPKSPQAEDFKEQPTPVTAVPEYRSTEVPQYRGTAAPESRNTTRKPTRRRTRLDSNLSPAESKVLEQLVRLIHVGFSLTSGRCRIAVLQRTDGLLVRTRRCAPRSRGSN